ncbi:disks large-associated protein 5-like [Equus caballus]|uniref:disks large-associated protein 5-like n=1 Tax=Equus caballus TaxID=9796 RepID=UPI0038B23A19
MDLSIIQSLQKTSERRPIQGSVLLANKTGPGLRPTPFPEAESRAGRWRKGPRVTAAGRRDPQIQDLRHKFNSLTILEECGWEKASNTSKDVFQDKFVSGIASEPKQDGAGIADGGRLAAVKKAVRERMQPGERAEAVGSAVPKEVDHIMFDAGSFRIESPVKSFSATPGVQYPFTQVEER